MNILELQMFPKIRNQNPLPLISCLCPIFEIEHVDEVNESGVEETKLSKKKYFFSHLTGNSHSLSPFVPPLHAPHMFMSLLISNSLNEIQWAIS